MCVCVGMCVTNRGNGSHDDIVFDVKPNIHNEHLPTWPGTRYQDGRQRLCFCLPITVAEAIDRMSQVGYNA